MPARRHVWAQLQAERLTGMTAFATTSRGGFLRAGVSKNEARDVLWTHNSVELWDLLVRHGAGPTTASVAGSAASSSPRCCDPAARRQRRRNGACRR